MAPLRAAHPSSARNHGIHAFSTPLYTTTHEVAEFLNDVADAIAFFGVTRADAAECFASDLAAWVSAQYLLIAGGATQ